MFAGDYDHDVLQRATARGHVVAFCGVAGRAGAARLRQAAAQVRGLDRDSLRFSGAAGTQVELIRLATAKGLQAPAVAR